MNGLLLVEHHPEVLVLGTAETGRLFLVVLLDFLLDRPPRTLASVVERLQAELLNRIGHGDHLRVGLLEQSPSVGPALAAGPHQRDRDLFAR